MASIDLMGLHAMSGFYPKLLATPKKGMELCDRTLQNGVARRVEQVRVLYQLARLR